MTVTVTVGTVTVAVTGRACLVNRHGEPLPTVRRSYESLILVFPNFQLGSAAAVGVDSDSESRHLELQVSSVTLRLQVHWQVPEYRRRNGVTVTVAAGPGGGPSAGTARAGLSRLPVTRPGPGRGPGARLPPVRLGRDSVGDRRRDPLAAAVTDPATARVTPDAPARRHWHSDGQPEVSLVPRPPPLRLRRRWRH